MLKRVFWVALFTGLSHLVSLITISYIIRDLGEDISGYLGVIDSTIMLIASIISFGIQLAVNRNVATKTSWKSNYKLAQSARFMLSFFVATFGIGTYLIYGELHNLIYLFAPLVSLNGDYALYGNGKPIIASSLSFLRVAIPNIGILIVGSFGGMAAINTYIVLLAIGLFLAGIISSRVNHVHYFYLPRKNFVKFYFKYIKVGVFQVAGTLLFPSVLVIANLFYPIATIGLINGLLKLFIVYKGGLRIIVQTFFKEIKEEKTDLKIDKASLLAWGAISIPLMIFFKSTLLLLFENKYDHITYILPFLGVTMFLGAFRNAAEAKALIKKMDNLNLSVFLTALVIETVCIIGFSFTEYAIWGIPIGLFFAELTIVIGLGFGLYKIQFFLSRFKFLLRLAPPITIAIALRLILGESYIALGISLVIYIVWSFIFFRKLIFGSLTNME